MRTSIADELAAACVQRSFTLIERQRQTADRAFAVVTLIGLPE
jgi:hypothetical protein